MVGMLTWTSPNLNASLGIICGLKFLHFTHRDLGYGCERSPLCGKLYL
jgi:hypothetical protein